MSKDERLIASVASNDLVLELNDRQKQTLLNYVGYDYYANEKQLRRQLSGSEADEIEEEIASHKKASQFLINVQYLLSCYSMAVENLDFAPTGMATKKQFKNLHDTAEAFYNELIKLSPHYRAELKNVEYDVSSLIKKLSEFISVSDRFARKSQGKDSRGSKKEIAKKAIINALADNFDRFRAEGFTERNKIDFIKCALRLAGIPLPKRIKDLFYKANDKRIIFKQLQ